MARRKVRAPYADMRVYDQGAHVRVTIGEWGVHDFKQMWPGRHIPDTTVSFTFEKRTGDLVDLHPYEMDGPDVLALSQDAWNYASARLGLNDGGTHGYGGLGSAEAQQIGNTIYEQFGGGRAMAMLGGQAMILDMATDEPGRARMLGGLGIKWPNPKRSKGNYVEILLRPDDTYDMNFFNLTIRAKKLVKQYRGVYADQLRPLFEKQTGWYLSLGPVHGFGGREMTSPDKIYIGNFGDVNPLEYGGFFIWWHPPAAERPRLVKQILKGKDPARLKIRGGELDAVRTVNWCEATGECENEEYTLLEDMYVSVDDLLNADWINLEAAANTVGVSVRDLKKDPIRALDAVVAYMGAHEFGDHFFEDSFKDAAKFLINRGVPVEELSDYLED